MRVTPDASVRERWRCLDDLYELELDYPPARECATKLLAAALQGEVETDWAEVKRLAKCNAYKNWNDVKELVHEQAQAIQVRSPYHSDE